MSRFRYVAAVVALLSLTACKDDITSPLNDGPGSGLPGGGGGGGGTSNPGDTTTTNPGDTTSINPADTVGAGDPANNGPWTTPDSLTIQPVDPGVFDPTETGGAGTSGPSTALLFKTSGSGLYGVGTCGPNGMWTDPAGNIFGPHNPNCIDYGSTGAGNNGKGTCTTSPSGQPGLWLNPGGQSTHPFHSKCARTGTTTTALALTFAPQAQIFDANDGSGDRVMNFYSGGVVVSQLIYHGSSNTTTGAGLLLGSDNASPANTWSVFFGQPSLSYTGGLANGDLIDGMTSGGVEVVACNTAIGCSLVTLDLTLAP
jgi:hypothetical protein